MHLYRKIQKLSNMENNQYQNLIQKIDEFVRKYYMNDLIRGSLHTIAVVVASLVSFALLEHYIFNTSASSMAFRKGLLWTFTGVSVGALTYWVLWPLAHYLKLGKVISHEQAAQIIGQHFGNVKDKLLNVLQLKQQVTVAQTALVEASINQKIQELRPVPFKAAIDLTENKKYVRLAIIPIFVLLGLLVFSNIVENSAKRIINNDRDFEKDALFKLVLKDVEPKVVQFEDYEMLVEIEGEVLPQDVFIEVDNYQYKLEKVNNTTFKHKFFKLQKDVNFKLSASGAATKSGKIDVLEKPNIVNFDIKLNYPSYVGRKAETLSNVGDLTVPAGTQLDWAFMSQFTDNVALKFGDETTAEAVRNGENGFTFSKKALKDGQYKIIMSNKNLPNGDSVTYTLSVIPDMHPTIEVQKFQDSLNKKVVFFAGEASDDYGIRNINFHYELSREGKMVEQKTIPIALGKGRQAAYEYVLDVNALPLQAGDKLSYYFQVFDNDGVSGSKSAKTATMFYELPTVAQLEKMEAENNSEIKSDLDKTMEELKELQNNMRKAQNSILQKEDLNWQDRKELENLIQQQKEIEKNLKDAKEKMDENKKNAEEQKEKIDPKLAEKQEMLDKLMEELMNDEMKKMFEELEKMLDQMNKEQVMEKLKEMQMSDEEMQKEIERMTELFKQLEVEKELNEAIDKLDSLAQKQEDLSKQTEQQDNKNDAAKQEELQKEQQKLNEEFKDLKEKLEKTAEKNEKLEEPMEMDMQELQEQSKDIQEEMQNSKQDLNKKQNSKASKSQKNASKKMKEMSKDMKNKMQQQDKEEQEKDLKAMRQLLENLVTLSFEQEELQADIEKTAVTAPNYVRLVQKQYKIKDDFRHVEDSLQALAKRVFQLQSYITEKATDVKKSVQKSLLLLEDRQKRPATVQQQYSMTALNDLALMLSESMEQMQQSMAEQMAGQQMCEKPGDKEGEGEEGKGGKGGKKGKGKMGQMRKMQEQLQQQLQDMKDGKTPGNSKQFAEMAAKQAAIRKALQELKNQQQQEGKGGKGGKELQDLIDQMDKVETDLVNKKVPDAETMKRQQDIVTRLLEAENSEREREYEEKRKAEQADVVEQKMPPAMQEYLRQRQSQVDMFKTVSPSLKPYYKNLVEQYFNSLK